MLQLSEFVWALRSSAWVVFNNFLLIDPTDRSKISSDQKRLFFAVILYPLSFFANTPFNEDEVNFYFYSENPYVYVFLYKKISLMSETNLVQSKISESMQNVSTNWKRFTSASENKILKPKKEFYFWNKRYVQYISVQVKLWYHIYPCTIICEIMFPNKWSPGNKDKHVLPFIS